MKRITLALGILGLLLVTSTADAHWYRGGGVGNSFFGHGGYGGYGGSAFPLRTVGYGYSYYGASFAPGYLPAATYSYPVAPAATYLPPAAEVYQAPPAPVYYYSQPAYAPPTVSYAPAYRLYYPGCAR